MSTPRSLQGADGRATLVRLTDTLMYSITMWYKRNECGLRMAIFFSAATAAGAFGGLLARGITEMDGLAHIRGWAWIFIIEGLVTIATGRLLDQGSEYC